MMKKKNYPLRIFLIFILSLLIGTYFPQCAHTFTGYDSYGDGWNGAYLYIDTTPYGFLSDVDWIDSLGTWPQNHTQQLVDVGCLTIGIEELENTNFIPTHYYDLLGRKVDPVKGFYLASDGVLTKKVYINATK